MKLTKNTVDAGSGFFVARYTSIALPGLVLDHWNKLWYIKHARSGRYLTASVDKGEAVRIFEHLCRWSYINWTGPWESFESIVFKIIDQACKAAIRGRLKQRNFLTNAE